VKSALPDYSVSFLIVEENSMKLARRKCGAAACQRPAKVEKLNRSLRSILAGIIALAVVVLVGAVAGAVVDDGSGVQLAQNTSTQTKKPTISLPNDNDKKPASGQSTEPQDKKPVTGKDKDKVTDDPKEPKKDVTPEGGSGRVGGDSSNLIVEGPFGIKSKGKRIVYILDRSGSMCYGRVLWNSERQTRLIGAKSNMQILRLELAKALHALAKSDPDSQFCILFYDDRITMMEKEVKWYTAKTDVERAIKWVNTITPRGETKPLAAFDLAFHLKPMPDLIYFMTDGVIPDDTHEKIDQLNPYKKQFVNGKKVKAVTIHTIQFVVPEYDRVSLWMSRWDGDPKMPVEIAQAIEFNKRSRPQFLVPDAKLKFQYWQIKQIADNTGGKCVYIPNNGEGAVFSDNPAPPPERDPSEAAGQGVTKGVPASTKPGEGGLAPGLPPPVGVKFGGGGGGKQPKINPPKSGNPEKGGNNLPPGFNPGQGGVNPPAVNPGQGGNNPPPGFPPTVEGGKSS
jgi:hypothetical protein